MDKIVIFGAHPDDVLGLAGLVLRMKGLYDVHLLDASLGERGLRGASLEETAAIRRLEEEQACAMLGATPHFLGEIDGEIFAGRDCCQKTAELLRRLSPKAVFTHWPADIHPDHVVTTAIAFRSLNMAGLQPEIIFGEETYQSRLFAPTHYVDVTEVFEEKLAVIRAYRCQNPDDSLVRDKELCARFHGAKCGCPFAEAFAQFAPTDGRRPSILDKFQPYRDNYYA